MTKLSRSAVAFALILALGALGACGSDSDKEEASKPAAAPPDGISKDEAKRADADARTTARNVVTEIELCFVEQQTYKGCESKAADVSAKTTAVGYTVTVKSESGDEFVVTKAGDGTLERTSSAGTPW